jgi:hypothetical protein
MHFDTISNLCPKYCIKLKSNNKVLLIDNNLFAQIHQYLLIKLLSNYKIIKAYGPRHIKC